MTNNVIVQPTEAEIIDNAISGVYRPRSSEISRVVNVGYGEDYHVLKILFWEDIQPTGRRIRRVILKTKHDTELSNEKHNKLIALVEDTTRMPIAEFTQGVFGYKH
jgi:hypothetical protein